MRFGFSVILLLLTSSLFGGEVFPVSGEALRGDIVELNDREVVVNQNGKKTTRPIKEVLRVEFREPSRLPADKPVALIDLTDGSQLYAGQILLKKKEFEATLLSGGVVKIPTSLVLGVLMNATDETNRREWKTRLFNMRGKEAVVVKRGETISSLEAVLGDGDESGTSISFAVTLEGETRAATRKLASLHGLIFKNSLPPTAGPFTCKMLDSAQNFLMVSTLTGKEGGVSVTTPAGVKLDLPFERIVRVDYTQGRLEYLSDLTPTKIVTRSNLDDEETPDQWHVYKDSNLDKKLMVLAGVTYSKGLALKPYAELIFELKGDYREFEAMAGIDDGISVAGSAILQIEGDGKELASIQLPAPDKSRVKALKISVKDVQRLRIIVRSDGEFDTARHLDLADAKIRKEDR